MCSCLFQGLLWDASSVPPSVWTRHDKGACAHTRKGWPWLLLSLSRESQGLPAFHYETAFTHIPKEQLRIGVSSPPTHTHPFAFQAASLALGRKSLLHFVLFFQTSSLLIWWKRVCFPKLLFEKIEFARFLPAEKVCFLHLLHDRVAEGCIFHDSGFAPGVCSGRAQDRRKEKALICVGEIFQFRK